jgi:protein-S-isoprenylcysteine O-methyltransferase Ste14
MLYGDMAWPPLLLSWMVFWYFFFHAQQSVHKETKTSLFFSLLTYAVFVSVGLLHLLVFATAVFSFSFAQELTGFILLWLGQGLMLFARHSLYFLSNRQVLFEISTRHVSAGPYLYFHHPMYVGLLVALAATCFMFNSIWGFAFLLFCVLPLFVVRAWIETK